MDRAEAFTSPGVMVSGPDECPVAQIAHRLHQRFLRVQNDRTVPCDRLVIWCAGDQQEANVLWTGPK